MTERQSDLIALVTLELGCLAPGHTSHLVFVHCVRRAKVEVGREIEWIDSAEGDKGEKRFIIIPLLTPRRTDQTSAMADGGW